MKKTNIGIILFLLAVATATPSQAAFVIGGENGWQFSTDGFLNVFGVYQATEKRPAPGLIGGNLQDPTINPDEAQQQFRVRTGLLPVGVGFTIKAPTINGVDSAVRLGLYPQVNNSGSSRTDISPNIDFREVNVTFDGKFGQVLAGRAINLYQAKNILTDMTLFGAGVVGPVNSGPTMGHIGYGYLYPNFGAQFRYTTPSMGGTKVAFSVNEPNQISGDGGVVAAKRNVPRLETEISYATVFNGGKLQSWVSGLYQSATFEQTSAVRAGGHATSLGGAGGVEVGVGKLDLLVSGYGGQALGMLGIQDFGALDATGKERQNWGYLAQVTYMLTPELKLGVNYGRSNAIKTADDTGNNIKAQHAAVGAITYNVNKLTQIIAEYTWAQDEWHNGLHQNSNMVALGTFFYW